MGGSSSVPEPVSNRVLYLLLLYLINSVRLHPAEARMLHQGEATVATKSIHIALNIRGVRSAQYIQDRKEKHEEKLNKIPLAAIEHVDR